ncbi:MAG: type ISP restriction/modification enzyme [Verrucomicrobiota bacterium]
MRELLAPAAGLCSPGKLQRQVAALLDTDTPVIGVTAGNVRPDFRTIAVLETTTGSRELDFRVTAGWGHAGKGGVTMPGKGKLVTRAFTAEETAAFGVAQASSLRVHEASLPRESAATTTGSKMTPEPAGRMPGLPLLGLATHDVWLNDTVCWRNVPEKVWDYTLGGYQVLKKWLSYREHGLLGRPLTTDEAREVTHTARRLAALILLQPALDTNYQRVKTAGHDVKP